MIMLKLSNVMVSKHNTYYITFTAEIVDGSDDEESGDGTFNDGSKHESGAEGTVDEAGAGGRKVFQAFGKTRHGCLRRSSCLFLQAQGSGKLINHLTRT